MNRVLGKPSRFITFTANTKWPGILHILQRRQTPDARPDISDTVFKQKFNALPYYLTQGHVFGNCMGVVFSVKNQMKGLPHAHILLFLQNNDVTWCADNVD